MSDDNKPVGFTPASGAPGQGAAEPNSQDRTITLAEAQTLIKDAITQSLRASQSLTDKSEARIRKDIQDKLSQIDQARKTFEAAGVTITPEIQEKIRRQVIDDSLIGGASGQAGTQPGAAPDMAADPISQAALRMMEEAGVTVLDTDPEVAMLDHSSPRAFLRTLDQAIEAKRARSGSGAQQPGTQPTAQRAPTNLAGQGARTGLMEQYQDEMTKTANQPQHIRLEIRRKYRRLGLNV